MSDKSEACPMCGTLVGADVEEINKPTVEEQPKPENPIPNEQPMKAKEEAAPMEYNTPTITPPPITPSNKPTKKSNKTPIIIGVVAAVVILGALSAFLLLRNHKTNESETQMAIEVPIEFDESYDESISYNSNETKLNGYEWIVGTWACDMGPYGTVVVKFDGDGSSGMCTEAQYGSFKTGTYNVSGNTLCYKLDGESVTTTIEIESEHRLAAGGGYYYHKRDSGDVQRYEDNNASTTSTQVPKVSSNAYEGNQVVVIDGSELRLRLGPSTSSDTFKWPDGTNRHPKVGEKFKYLGESGDFYKIDFKGNELWVSKQFSHMEEGTTTTRYTQVSCIKVSGGVWFVLDHRYSDGETIRLENATFGLYGATGNETKHQQLLSGGDGELLRIGQRSMYEASYGYVYFNLGQKLTSEYECHYGHVASKADGYILNMADVVLSPSNLSINGKLINSYSTRHLNLSTDMCLFANNKKGDDVVHNQTATLGTITITNNQGGITAQYTPVLDSNGKPCFYNTISGAFIYHSGSGTLGYEP